MSPRASKCSRCGEYSDDPIAEWSGTNSATPDGLHKFGLCDDCAEDFDGFVDGGPVLPLGSCEEGDGCDGSVEWDSANLSLGGSGRVATVTDMSLSWEPHPVGRSGGDDEPRLTGRQFRALLDLAMCADPWPASTENQSIVQNLLMNPEAEARGFDDWIHAYHGFDGGGDE